VASGAHGQREKLNGAGSESQKGTPGKGSPADFAFLCPKPPLGNFTKSIQSFKTSKPSERYAPAEGLCRLLSEPTPSHRLWAAASSATSALPIELSTGGRSGHSKPELSTLLGIGTFYFALTSGSFRLHGPRIEAVPHHAGKQGGNSSRNAAIPLPSVQTDLSIEKSAHNIWKSPISNGSSRFAVCSPGPNASRCRVAAQAACVESIVRRIEVPAVRSRSTQP
jgi:hypothetical protein